MTKRLHPLLLLALLTSVAPAADTTVEAKEQAFLGTRAAYWAFRPPVRAAATTAADKKIDQFILAALKAKNLKPSPPLSKTQLIRRATLDITGLPPAPAEVSAFLQDQAPNAYEKLVDRLMASPAYGERWALKWLDIVRYADTNGFELDKERTHAWRYRDYVINAFNSNKPYDRFIREQLAGDEITPSSPEALIATGYLRAGSEHLVSGNIDTDVSRQEVLTEIATNVGQTFLGLTVNCARCHNHKFDPILQADFYRLQAVFGGAKGKDVELAASGEKSTWEIADKAYQARLKPVTEALKALAEPYKLKLEQEGLAKLPNDLKEAWLTPKDKRTEKQKTLAANAKSQIEPTWDLIVEAMSPEDLAKRATLRTRLHEIEDAAPEPLTTAYAYVNSGDPAPQAHILRMGDPKDPLEAVDPAAPRIVRAGFQVPVSDTGRRTAFAEWLVSKDNPLTARVMVNRIWQLRMGVGLVKTPNDFGIMGGHPSNQALLDALAAEFRDMGWNIKTLDRQILLSDTYRQSTTGNPAAEKADPENRLLWRMNRKRLDAEALRDAVLVAAGTLNQKVGGSPVRIPIEPEVYDLIFTEYERDGLWPVSPDKNVQNRRGIYLLNKRGVRLPLMSAFDQPDAITSCPVRPVSTHALQALSLFNSDFMQEQSMALAKNLEKQCKSDARTCQIQTAWTRTLSRAATPKELAMARKFLAAGGTLQEMSLALLNRNEFVYVP